MTCSKPYTTFQTSFRALFKQHMVKNNCLFRINNTLSVLLSFLGHSVTNVFLVFSFYQCTLNK